ncbi:MAG: glycosyltransferase [Spirochaetia bacterium]|nr:MAG: glycosyltransferase [Spirochaetia bacterium]
MQSTFVSYTEASFRRGRWFRFLFRRRPIYGSVVEFAAKADKFDSCYVTGEDIGLPLAALLKLRRWKGRMVCVVHNVTARKARLFRLLGHKGFASFIVVSEDQRRRLIDGCHIPEAKIILVSNWVDTKFFQPEHGAQQSAVAKVMACGSESRDYATLVRAAANVDAEFDVYANGFNGSEKVDSRNRPNVRVVPRVSYEALRTAYRSCDAVAVPLKAVNYAAGVSGIIEAMACGKPVVVTRTDGIADYLPEVSPEWIVRPGDPADLGRALTDLLALSAEARAAIGRRNREWVVANCDIDQYAQTVRALLVGEHGSPSSPEATSPSLKLSC